MQRVMLAAKLHRATVTDRCVDYEGSIEIDENLMDEVEILAHEQVHIYNVNSGARFITYAIPGPRKSGRISVNGAAARLVEINDRIIIAAYGIMDSKSNDGYQPKALLLDEHNKVVERQGSLALSFNSSDVTA